MTRWEPGATDRLRAAALELFADQGYDRTTTAEIAARAGVTERTFFRHFDDKREVLFIGQETFQQGFLDGVAAARPGATPLEIVASALAGAAPFFPDDRRADVRRRDAVVSAHPALQERELLKLARLVRVLAEAMVGRGVPEPGATLAAESAVTVFRVAFSRWVEQDEQRPLQEIQRVVLEELTALTATGPLS